jgi:hypothetical protein
MLKSAVAGSQQLTSRRIFRFWVPLAAMWLMMALEQPLIAAFIAHLPDPEVNLAAYGVVFSIAVLIESPIIMLLTAGTALPKGGLSYRRLLRFSHLLIAGLTALHLLVGLTPLFDLIIRRVIRAPAEVIEHSRGAFLLMTPWTAAVGYRRLWQGVLIRFHRTGVVPVTIAVRLVVAAIMLAAGFLLQRLPGVHVGAAALSAGVIAAALAAFLFARPVVRKNLQEPSQEEEPLSWRELIGFYVPLGMTSIILLAARPLLTLALTRLPDPLDSLAVWPVLLSVVFLGRSIAVSYQETVVALLKDRCSLRMLRRFAYILAAGLLAVFFVFSGTPAARIWFREVAGLSARLAGVVRLPMAVLALLPALSALISWQRGILVAVRRTPAITRSVVLNLSVLGTALIVLGSTLKAAGTLIVAIAYVVSVTAEWLYVTYSGNRARRLYESRDVFLFKML